MYSRRNYVSRPSRGSRGRGVVRNSRRNDRLERSKKLLEFNLTLSPDVINIEDTELNLKKCLEHCGFGVIKYQQLELPEKEEHKPKCNEKIYEVQSIVNSTKSDSYVHYKAIVKNWCSKHHNHWLTLTRKESFHQSKAAFNQDVRLKRFCFGTLVSQTDYIYHHCLNSITANFYHDTRVLRMRPNQRRKTDSLEQVLIISYDSIRRIVVDAYSWVILIEVKHPPPVILKDKRILTFCSTDRDIQGKSNVLLLDVGSELDVERLVSRLHFCLNKMPIHYTRIRYSSKQYLNLPNFVLSHFDCTFNLLAIASRNFVLLEQTRHYWDNFLNRMQELCEEDHQSLSKALEDASNLLEKGAVCDYPKFIQSAYDWYVYKKEVLTGNIEKYFIPVNTRMTRKLVLTPVQTLFYPRELQFDNRLLRNFDADYALRVSFRDDDNRRLSSMASQDDVLLHSAITEPLKNGITVGDRRYELLGWSTSQVRDHGIWMYAKDDRGDTAATIRKWMGDFSGTKSMPKLMARLGQCFSQTEDTIEVPREQITTEDDIEGGENPNTGEAYCFSDGIGKMSVELAEAVRTKLELKNVPCAYQFRYAGYKGMLALDPELTGTGIHIVFRKSMKKFNSNSNKLEIVKKCQAIPVQLNRPMINIMNQLGVKNEVFLELQEKMLATVTDILIDDEKAAEYLVSKMTLKLVENFNDMVQAGIGLTGDPLFRGMLLCLRDRVILDIKTKARLAIDPTEGRNMFGVLDETKTLEYGQVFVQYTKDILNQETNTETEIYTGTVLVSKNPCTQPGDIRLLEAVDVPQLHHLVDCVVFPQKGPRPHPNEMAGSDLDGDEYSVIWKKDLFISGNREPENFPSHGGQQQPITEFELEKSIDVLREYIRYDQIGIIGNAHLAISDRQGIDVDVCKTIAHKFALSLDYVKTGYMVPLTIEEKPYEFPDFMERGTERETYKSERALGELYRNCKLFEQKLTAIGSENVEIKVDPDLEYPGWQEYKDSANRSRQKYNHLLETLMQKYGVQTEIEAISGAFRGLHNRHSQRHDVVDAENLIINSVERLHENFRTEFYQEFDTSEENECIGVDDLQENILKKASAWYMVTYNSSSTRLLSFPWIVAKYLITIKIRRRTNGTVLSNSIMTILNQRIQPIITKLPKLISEDEVKADAFPITPDTIKLTYRLIVKWAKSEGKLPPPDERKLAKYFHTFLEESLCSNPEDVDTEESIIIKPNIINLCFAFFRKARRTSTLPVGLEWLSSLARDAYHVLAATGNVSVICPLKEENKPSDIVELETVKVIDKIIPGKSKQELRKIIEFMIKLKSITIRKERNYFVISATGMWEEITTLQTFFKTDTETLKNKLVELHNICKRFH